MTTKPRREPEHRIVVGVDGSKSSRDALAWAVGQALQTGAVVEALTACPYLNAYGYPLPVRGVDIAKRAAGTVEHAIAEIPAHTNAAVIRHRVVQGDAPHVLVDASAGADLLVVGNRGHGGFVEALLGSTGEYCVHHASCPVVVIQDDAAQRHRRSYD
jgi:nucleotide-binding universal stress UspA family protein